MLLTQHLPKTRYNEQDVSAISAISASWWKSEQDRGNPRYLHWVSGCLIHSCGTSIIHSTYPKEKGIRWLGRLVYSPCLSTYWAPSLSLGVWMLITWMKAWQHRWRWTWLSRSPLRIWTASTIYLPRSISRIPKIHLWRMDPDFLYSNGHQGVNLSTIIALIALTAHLPLQVHHKVHPRPHRVLGLLEYCTISCMDLSMYSSGRCLGSYKARDSKMLYTGSSSESHHVSS